MNQEAKQSIASGNDTRLKHFIYLDRSRLNSYTAQISDGLTQIRRLSETINRKEINNPAEEYHEQTQEKSSSAEGSVGTNIAMKVSGKGDRKQTNKSGSKYQSGSVLESNDSKNFSEDKLDHDNLYLLLEQHLIQNNILKELIDSRHLADYQSQIVKITAPTRFFDWSMIHKLFENPNSLKMMLSANEVNAGNPMSDDIIELMSYFLNICSVGSITAHLELESKKILCALNPQHFVITMDQLRGMYILSGDIEVTIVGFLNKRRLRSNNITGLVGQVDITDISSAIVGDVDFFVEPIAIYSNL